MANKDGAGVKAEMWNIDPQPGCKQWPIHDTPASLHNRSEDMVNTTFASNVGILDLEEIPCPQISKCATDADWNQNKAPKCVSLPVETKHTFSHLSMSEESQGGGYCSCEISKPHQHQEVQ